MSFTRPRLERTQSPAHGSWLQASYGRWVRGGRRAPAPPGNPMGGHTSGWTTGVQPFRLGVIALCFGFRCGTEADGAPWKGVPVFNRRQSGQTRVGCVRILGPGGRKWGA